LIDASEKIVGLLGWPIEHSLSPVMHNAAFKALGLDWRYHLFPTSPNRFNKEIRTFLALDVQGFNVTIPYKKAALKYLDTIETTAKKLGAVNTITINQNQGSEKISCGYNTDVEGFLNALKKGGFEQMSGKKAVVIGAGGAARAVLYGLICEGISEITILNRSFQTAQQLYGVFNKFTCRLKILPLTTKNLIDSASEAALLVNATPIGSLPAPEKTIWPDHVPLPSNITIFDLVYNPPITKLLKQGEASNAAIISGIEMLVHQGALSFQMWTKKQAPTEVMRQACYKKIGGRHV
jgi:shikimate dehydrogenase